MSDRIKQLINDQRNTLDTMESKLSQYVNDTCGVLQSQADEMENELADLREELTTLQQHNTELEAARDEWLRIATILSIVSDDDLAYLARRSPSSAEAIARAKTALKHHDPLNGGAS